MDKNEVINVLDQVIKVIQNDPRQAICLPIRNIGGEEMHEYVKRFMHKYKPRPDIEGYWFDQSPASAKKRIRILQNVILDVHYHRIDDSPRKKGKNTFGTYTKQSWKHRIVCIHKETNSIHILIKYTIDYGEITTWSRHYGYCSDKIENFEFYTLKNK